MTLSKIMRSRANVYRLSQHDAAYSRALDAVGEAANHGRYQCEFDFAEFSPEQQLDAINRLRGENFVVLVNDRAVTITW